MPTGPVLAVGALIGIAWLGGSAMVHGVKKAGKAVGHAVVHVVKHQPKPTSPAQQGK